MDAKPRPEICKAIENRNRIEFIYHEKLRVGEPQCYGISLTGKPALRVHLIKGGSRPEQMFTLDKMSSIKILKEHFDNPGPNYKKGDTAMSIIFCEL
jgi:hypothetical protein